MPDNPTSFCVHNGKVFILGDEQECRLSQPRRVGARCGVILRFGLPLLSTSIDSAGGIVGWRGVQGAFSLGSEWPIERGRRHPTPYQK